MSDRQVTTGHESARERTAARSSTERTTRPAALRLTNDDRARLLRYGGTVRAAVLRLLELAEHHEACPPPRRRPTKMPPPPVQRFTPALPPVTYHVDRPSDSPLVTTDHQLALDTAREHGTRVRRA